MYDTVVVVLYVTAIGTLLLLLLKSMNKTAEGFQQTSVTQQDIDNTITAKLRDYTTSVVDKKLQDVQKSIDDKTNAVASWTVTTAAG
jgi:cell division protein FtsX